MKRRNDDVHPADEDIDVEDKRFSLPCLQLAAAVCSEHTPEHSNCLERTTLYILKTVRTAWRIDRNRWALASDRQECREYR